MIPVIKTVVDFTVFLVGASVFVSNSDKHTKQELFLPKAAL